MNNHTAQRPFVFALVGPTGSGKTAAAIRIAQEINAEIISMDSMQIYRGMDIGTAKPDQSELSAVRHHMIDITDPRDLFTVSAYRDMAFECIEDIRARGKHALFVGGTGLYLQAISYELSLGENGADTLLRTRLHEIAAQPGGEKRLHDMLRAVDPVSADKLHPHDIRRVIRALEIHESTGKAKSEQKDEGRKPGPYDVHVYGLTMPREQMYERINERVDKMMRDGLVDEVMRLLEAGVEPCKEGGAMQAIGYKEIVAALRGEISMDDAVALIKQSSRRYAKRQWTWFRRDPRTIWFDWSQYKAPDDLIHSLLVTMKQDLEAE
ncbi:MAG: tRNA (adenosine(37)-N6)-dimethylallyltransferase MiaA [Clostridia bacterium]|nr:tRNA (adenosine(37)-N6)-dimethylallyltransferase MiaA [Clostridia bacterium]